MMYLETERLILRPAQAKDADDYMEFCNSEFVLRYNAMTVKSKEEVVKQFAQQEDQWHTLVLDHKETGKVIGVVCTEEDSLRWDVNSKEVSYLINEAFARQGYMKEALGALISYLFEAKELDCVTARSFAPNTASRNLLSSLGFHQDGLLPHCVKGYGGVIFDDAVYSLMREEHKVFGD